MCQIVSEFFLLNSKIIHSFPMNPNAVYTPYMRHRQFICISILRVLPNAEELFQ